MTELFGVLKNIRSEFPKAEVFVSTFDAFLLELNKVILRISSSHVSNVYRL